MGKTPGTIALQYPKHLIQHPLLPQSSFKHSIQFHRMTTNALPLYQQGLIAKSTALVAAITVCGKKSS
jgi:hypothetical protein